MIKSVQGIEIGDIYVFNGYRFKVKSFPTRTSAVLESVLQISGNVSTMKVVISKLTKYYANV